MADDLLTEEELAMLDEDGGITDDTDDEWIDSELIAPQLDEPEDAPPPEEEYYEEPEEEKVFESSDRYREVTMTDTVPPELEAAAAELAKKFDDSDIDITEYLKQRATIDRQIMTYQIEEANAQKQYNAWMDAQDQFMHDNSHYEENRVLYGALDNAVIEIKNDPRSKGLTPTQILHAADYLVRDIFGAKGEAQEGKKRQDVDKAVRETNVAPTLPTLDKVPSSAANSTGQDPFSAIERLTGDAKEAAVARLSKEQYAQYLAS